MNLHFYKYHGLGNDYIILNTVENNIRNEDEIKSKLSENLCKRHFSIGGDGILYAVPATSNEYDYQMQIFNPDGSEAEMCGNGIRMFAKYLYTTNVLKKKVYRIETKAGLIVPELIFKNNEITGIKVDMGTPKLSRSEIPMIGPNGRVINEDFRIDDKKFKITCVNMGNPHCIIFVEDVEKIDITIGRLIEYHKKFPNRINVEFAQILNEKEIKVRVWERGVGETLACGTGACATAVAAILNSMTDNDVKIHLKGGDLMINWATNSSVFMTGPAEKVFEGQININLE